MRRVLLGLTVLLLVALPGPIAAAAEAPAPPSTETTPATEVPAPPVPEVTPEVIQARLKQIESDTSLQEAEKKEILARYNEALAELELVQSHTARAEQLTKEAQQAPEELKRLEADLQAAPPADTPAVPADATAAELQQRVTELETDLEARRERLGALETKLKSSAERKASLPERITAARKRLTEVGAALAALPEADAAGPALRSRRALLEARQRATSAEIKALEAELATFDTLTRLLTARRDLAARDLARAEKRIEPWRKALARARSREAAQAVSEAEEAARRAAGQHPLVAQLADENKELAARRTGPESLLARHESAQRELERIERETERIQRDFEEVTADVAVAGLTEEMGRVLRQRQEQLRRRDVSQSRIRDRKRELAEVLLSLAALRRREDDLKNVDARVETLVASLDRALGPERIDRIADAARHLFETRKRLLGDLIGDHRKYSSLLIQLNLKEQELAAAAEAFADYISERVLWVRSGAPLGVGHLAAAADAAAWFASPGGWADVGRSLWQDMLRHPLYWIPAAALLAAMAVTRRKSRRALQFLGKQVIRVETDAFGHTVRAGLLTVWLVLLGPLAVGFLGWRLAAGTGSFPRAVGAGLEATAAVYLLLEIARALSLRDGLGHQHFRWGARSLRIIRKRFFRPMLGLLPVVAIVAALEAQPLEAYRNSLGRLVMMAGLLGFGVLLLRVLRPGGDLMKAFLARRRDGWLDRLRYVWFPLAVAVPVGLAVAVGAGYYYTAVELARRLVVTLWLVAGLAVVYGLTMRVLFMARRRLAVQRAEQRREAAQAAAEAAGGQDADEAEPVPVQPAAEEEETSLGAISDQTRRLVRSLVALGMLVGLWLIWVDVLPALRVFQEVDIWTYGDGTVVTLADLAAAVLVVVVTVLAAQNLPGLLEVAVLQHLPLAAGVRFAITTVSRYVITIVGIVVAFALVGVGWSKVQWLAAAITVGLGFGLQEIFANFVSGLIILFERPMRVGDVVSVGETTGYVTRIRIRATTITDWDRKELIVPNKEFVTGRLVNWSLSDDLLRLTLDVGIAYGSDTALATDLLLKCARESPDVLEDPPPSAYFDRFGDSALIFKLRFYIAGVQHWLLSRDRLHRAIDDAFRKHRIEVAFPQQDIHVRTIRPELALKLEHEGGAEVPKKKDV
ncbi:MAG: mechanosensitive ion channel [Phycisphaerae bacterium]